MLIKINAENTTSGNPRRGWIHLDNRGYFIKFYDEGYDNGGRELMELLKTEGEGMPINVTPKEYKRIKGLRAGSGI